jgi:hypothetical protein
MMHSDSRSSFSSRSLQFLGFFCTVCLAVLALTAAFKFSAPLSSDTVVLPVEVFPPDGASMHSERVAVEVSDPTGVDWLYVKGHALGYHKSDYADQNGYDQKASFRINGGDWVPISNSTAECVYPDRLYKIDSEDTGTTAGCIGGPLHTVRLEVPVSGTGALTAGTNEIEFRFNGTDGFGSGYRILDFELRTSQGGANAIDGTQFVEADYDSWTAPDGGDASNGGSLWRQRNFLKEGPGGDVIVASCADCHARTGEDLKFYNYSNKSIQARSRFHGLTDQQAKDVAAYIRQVDIDLPTGYTVADAGRPWNPPYQPGPNLAEKPAELWAAGAGLEWVLDDEQEVPGTDRDMATYMIPNGPSDLSVVHPDSTLQAWKQPIAMQLPDWNNWLPDVHPFDVYGQSAWEGTNLYSVYRDEIVNEWDDPSQLQADVDAAINDAQTCSQYIQGAAETMRRFNIARWQSEYESLSKDPQYEGSPDPKIDELGAHQWMSVKLWEVHNQYDLQTVTRQMYTPNNDCGRFWGGNHRSWLGNNNSIYDVAPHKNSKPEYPNSDTYADSRQNQFFTSAWYELQLILGPNQGNNDHGNPFDWNYHAPHISSHDRIYGHSQGLRQLRGQVVVQQQKSMYRTTLNNEFDPGWNMHNMQPTRMFWSQNDAPLESMNQATRRDVTEAIMRAWITYSDRIATSDWPRGENWGSGELLPSSYTPTSGSTIGDAGSKADYIYRMMPKAQNLGVSADVIDEFARWGESMWPNGNWEQWFCSTCSPDATPSQTLALNQGWSLVSSHVAPSEAALETVFDPILSDVVLVKDDNGDSFFPSENINSIGDWSAAEAYFVYSEASHSLEMSGMSVNETAELELTAGWNLVPYYPRSSMTTEDAFASLGNDLVIVKNIEGEFYLPEDNIDTIAETQPGQGYKVYVRNDVTLQYPSSSKSTAAGSASKSGGESRRAASLSTGNLIVEAPGQPNGARIEVQTPDGQVVGSGTVRDGRAAVVVYEDSPMTPADDGAKSGERLLLYARASGTASPEPMQIDGVRNLLTQTTPSELVYKSDLLASVRLERTAAQSVRLRPSAPNPVQSTATLRFSLPSETDVTLEVYDVLGRRIQRLVNGRKSAGWHSMQFDARRLSSGVYFLRLDAAGVQETRKITVVR